MINKQEKNQSTEQKFMASINQAIALKIGDAISKLVLQMLNK